MSKPSPHRRRIAERLQTLQQFVHGELWDVDLAALPRIKQFGFLLIRIGAIVGKGLIADKCALQSAALSYITLVSLVPVLALSFAVSRGLGAHDRVMDILETNLAELPEKTRVFVTQVLELVERVNYGALGTIGLLIIFFSAVGMLAKIEKSFNAIWGVQKPRSAFRKFTDYISILVVVPLLMLLATSVNTAMSTGSFAAFLETNLGSLYWMYEKLIGLSGIAMLCLAFAFLYMFMPNTNVRFGPALLSGILAGTLWFLAQRAYIQWQVGVTLKNAIYGTFAAIPFFLGWLYVSWLIVLFGAEVCFGVQNLGTFVMERDSAFSSLSTRELIGLTATYQTCQAFLAGDHTWDAETFAHQNDIPSRLMTEVMHTLVTENILIAVETDRKTLYIPAEAPDNLTLRSVVDAFRGTPDEPTLRIVREKADKAYQNFSPPIETMRENLGKISFRSIIEKDRACKANPA
ncbi:MAG: YihY/virulence factor BrkB family protein [Verrucomicrobiota bacterium]